MSEPTGSISDQTKQEGYDALVREIAPRIMHAPIQFIQDRTLGRPRAFRNIGRYVRYRHARDPQSLKSVFNDIIMACGLNREGTLEGDAVPRVAVVLAAALVRGSSPPQLRALYRRLGNLQEAAVLGELTGIVSCQDQFFIGDASTPGARLVVRGFGSAGPCMDNHLHRLLLAYKLVGTLLQRADAGFIRPCINGYGWMFGKSVAPTVKRAFHRFFGKLDATVTPSGLKFVKDRLPFAIAGPAQHAWVVANLLNLVRKRYFSRREEDLAVIVYGGRELGPNVPLISAGLCRPNHHAFVHIDDGAFNLFTVDGLARALLHELCHVWGDCLDHGYREKCVVLAKTNPGQALSNADSYAYFITQAFQFSYRTKTFSPKLEREACGFAAMKR